LISQTITALVENKCTFSLKVEISLDMKIENVQSQYYRIKRFFSGVHACVHGADALIN